MDSGELWLGLVSLRRLELSQGPLLMVRVRDISESRRYEDRLRSLAYEDPLTGLPNRAATLDWLQEQLPAQSSTAPGTAAARSGRLPAGERQLR